MKWSSYLGVFALAFIVNLGSALADHELPAGSLRRLHTDTHQLENAVRYSSLRYHVKDAVFRFANEVYNFYTCTGGHIDNWDHDTIPGSCEYALQRVRSTFYPVQRYLYDTYYDYPHVYYRYLDVERDIRILPF